MWQRACVRQDSGMLLCLHFQHSLNFQHEGVDPDRAALRVRMQSAELDHSQARHCQQL